MSKKKASKQKRSKSKSGRKSKHKKKYVASSSSSSSSSTSSSSSSSSSSDSDTEVQSKKVEINKRKPRADDRTCRRNSRKSERSRSSVKKSHKKRSRSTSSSSSSPPPKKRKKARKSKKKREKKKKLEVETVTEAKPDVANEPDKIIYEPPGSKQGPKPRVMKPMTKDEWDKQQSVVRRVYDEETGRERLIKGDGEVLEEIVSKDRHKQINKVSSKGDGYSYAKHMGLT